MKSLCRSRTELSRKDLMGKQTYFGGQASTKNYARCGAPTTFHTVSEGEFCELRLTEVLGSCGYRVLFGVHKYWAWCILLFYDVG